MVLLVDEGPPLPLEAVLDGRRSEPWLGDVAAFVDVALKAGILYVESGNSHSSASLLR